MFIAASIFMTICGIVSGWFVGRRFLVIELCNYVTLNTQWDKDQLSREAKDYIAYRKLTEREKQ